MNPYVKLGLTALFPVALSVVLFLLDKKTKFRDLNYWFKQILIGVLFGGMAVIGTEFGVSVVGVTMNVRDAAPLCAGLIFGAPAGIIAGVIGGVERFFAAYWGAGVYTQWACSIATVLAGLFAANVRHFLFDDQRPTWGYGFFMGIIIEVVHMLLVLLTHLSDPRNCLPVIRKCTVPMMLVCGTATFLALFAVGLLDGRRLFQFGEKSGITELFQRRLLICVLVAFATTSGFTYVLEMRSAESEMQSLLALNIEDVEQEIADMSDRNLLQITRAVAEDLGDRLSVTDRQLAELKEQYGVAVIEVIDPMGIITHATEPADVGFDMHSGEQAAEFLVLLDGVTTEYVQEYQSISRDAAIQRKYAGVTLNGGGFVQVAHDAKSFQADIADNVAGLTENRRVGESGFVLVANSRGTIVSDPHGYAGQSLSFSSLDVVHKDMDPGVIYPVRNVFGGHVYAMYDTCEGYYIIAAMPQDEVNYARDMAVYTSIYTEVAIFTALFVMVYFLIKNLIGRNINRVNESLDKITAGDLDEVVDVRRSREFAALSDDINSTVDTLKRYIDEAAARIDQELEFAKTIQHSALPSVFPPYPNRTEFDIFADMVTAKEVGGDFYDFYLLGEDRLAFLIADVSGKGIPAAMFMMTSKTLIKSHAETGAPIDEVFRYANDELCGSNEAGMFVTAWMGILDLKTGEVEFVNAGHNPPVILHADGTAEYFKSRAGFVLAGMEGFPYKKNTFRMEPGDRILLYTDGVTEATDANEELFGEDRLLRAIHAADLTSAETLCRSIKTDVDAFVGDAPQFDDITMLSLTYKPNRGGTDMKELTIPALVENIEVVTDFVNEQLEPLDCPMRAQMQIDVAIDELFGNIANYAYTPGTGDAIVRMETDAAERTVSITFIDRGVPYDPLAHEDPDITLSAEERPVGGLGIFMVKKTMDDVLYRYEDGQNILTIVKKI